MFVKPSNIYNCSEIDTPVTKVRVITKKSPDLIIKVGLSLCLVIKFLSQKNFIVKVIMADVYAIQLRGHVN